MNNLKTPEAKRGTKYRFHIELVEGSSVSQDRGHPEDSVHHQDSSKVQLGRSDRVLPLAVWKNST